MATTIQWDAAENSGKVRKPLAAAASRPEFLADVERAKGFAIILVVLGHVVARQPPAGNEWYVVLKSAIYFFHMPFFMYLGGLVFFHIGDALNPRPDYWRYLVRRAERLLIPFLALGLLILFGKLGAERFVHVDNTPASVWSGLETLFWNTAESPATSVWYVLVLFVYCALTPALLKLTRGRLWPVVVLAAVLHCFSLPEVAYLDRIGYFYIYFMIGCLIGRYRSQAMRWIDTTIILSAALFSASIVLAVMGIQPALTGTICALSSLPFIHGLMRTNWSDRAATLLWFGKFSFVIYLFNTLAIGVSKGLLLKAISWDGTNFLIFFPILLASGLLLPIVAKRMFFDRIPILQRLTR